MSQIIITTQKGKAERKSARDLRNLIRGIYACFLEMKQVPWVQERALLGSCLKRIRGYDIGEERGGSRHSFAR